MSCAYHDQEERVYTEGYYSRCAESVIHLIEKANGFEVFTTPEDIPVNHITVDMEAKTVELNCPCAGCALERLMWAASVTQSATLGRRISVSQVSEYLGIRLERSETNWLRNTFILPYDSRKDTEDHIRLVKQYLSGIAFQLEQRGRFHDQSKLESPEKEVFDKVTPKLKELTYGTEEYKASLKEMGPALAHHYIQNRHHAEYFTLLKCVDCGTVVSSDPSQNTIMPGIVGEHGQLIAPPAQVCGECSGRLAKHTGLEGMNLVDLVEMFVDWCAATEGHEDGDIGKSIDHNADRYSTGSVLVHIFKNTARDMAVGKNYQNL